jgi:hypothetical protein
MSYKNRRERERKRKQITQDAEAQAIEVLAKLRADRGLSRDEVVSDAALVSEAIGYFPPGSRPIESYLAARLDGAGNSEEERDGLVGELLLSRNDRWSGRKADAKRMKANAKRLRERGR